MPNSLLEHCRVLCLKHCCQCCHWLQWCPGHTLYKHKYLQIWSQERADNLCKKYFWVKQTVQAKHNPLILVLFISWFQLLDIFCSQNYCRFLLLIILYYHRLYYTVVSHSRITLRWPISIHVQKVIPFYLNYLVLQFSQTGYKTEGMSL